ncbi:MAG: glycogen synthase GlgA [Gemmataceae bacterium]|nr:glycogen synthase GlgA [Gemmataceae bacterium]
MKCLHAASEVAGFAKTGGLADVVGSLPAALANRGIDCAVVMPLYRACRSASVPPTPTEHRFRLPIGERMFEGRLWRSTLPDTDVPIYFIEQPDFFDRDDAEQGRGIYQFTTSAGQRQDYDDNSTRYGFFARAVLEMIRLTNFWPDILHLHDWPTGLTPAYLREVYQRHGKPALRGSYAAIRTVFTIHNLAYQGAFPPDDLPALGLPWNLFTYDKLESYGALNYLKSGLVFADLLTTVSPMYAKEIQTPEHGCGLQGVLKLRATQMHGIVNGIDGNIWNPATDPALTGNYDVNTVGQGKPKCKAALQALFKLEVSPRTPLLGMVSRLASQKGFDLVEQVIPDYLRRGVQLALLGDGDKGYRDMLLRLREQFPTQVGLHLDYSEAIAHQIEAGADIFLMPSRYEPCGLNQLYSLKYGTIPVVHTTGGLADTVIDATSESIAMCRATGFAFDTYKAAAFDEALRRAVQTYRDSPLLWKQIQETGMKQDWSWSRSAGEYERLYRQLLQEL